MAAVPGFIGRKPIKRGFRCIFEKTFDPSPRGNVRVCDVNDHSVTQMQCGLPLTQGISQPGTGEEGG